MIVLRDKDVSIKNNTTNTSQKKYRLIKAIEPKREKKRMLILKLK